MMDQFRELGRRTVKKVYLITYSRVNEQLCDSRNKFADLVIEAFQFERGNVRPLHWAVSREPHETQGFHYHMALCLNGNKRWLQAKNYLANTGIVVNFQGTGRCV